MKENKEIVREGVKAHEANKIGTDTCHPISLYKKERTIRFLFMEEKMRI